MAPGVDEQYGYDECGEYNVCEVEREPEAHYPGSQRRADVCPHYDRDGLGEGQQARIDKRDGHHRGG